MVRAIIAFKSSDKLSCVKQLENVNFHVRHLLLIFYENLIESRISRSVWLSYIQGFQGWGVGRYIGGEFIKYDGLSGNHVLFFQAIDAFLGMDRYLSDENMVRYIPVNQRRFCEALKRCTFRAKIGGGNRPSDAVDMKIEEEFRKIAGQLKVNQPVLFSYYVSIRLY